MPWSLTAAAAAGGGGAAAAAAAAAAAFDFPHRDEANITEGDPLD
jgi:hypothetical protein